MKLKYMRTDLPKLCLLIIFLVFEIGKGFTQDRSHTDGEMIVWFHKNADIENLARNFSSVQLRPKKLLSARLNIWLMEYFPSAQGAEDILSYVRENPSVAFAQYNHYVALRNNTPNDPMFANQWSLLNTGQSGGTPGADADAIAAWDTTTGGLTTMGDTIVVAIVDGGCDLLHEDLSFWKNKNDTPGNSMDDDGNGYVDDYDGWNAYNSDGNIPVNDHGTRVAGIAAAIGNNGKGIAGVNWGAKVLPVAGSSNTESVVVEAYGYVFAMREKYNLTNGDSGAFIVSTNSSFGVNYGQPASYPIWCAFYDTLGSVGILNAGATANLNIDIDVDGDIPTACISPYMIAVTNTDNNDNRNSGAAYGDTTIDLGAPGTNILSTYPGNSYSTLDGTSMATPHVAGAIALLYAAACPQFIQDYKTDPAGMALKIKDYLLNGTDPIASLNGITVTGGRLNLKNSILLLRSDTAYKCGTVVSIGENNLSNDEKQLKIFHTYPNPADDEISIQFYLPYRSDIKIFMTNVLGQEMLVKNISSVTGSHVESIAISQLPPGIYFLSLTSNSSRSHTIKVIVF